MNLITVILLALGLCFDSFAVSLSHGITQCGERRTHFFRFSLVLAFFQGAMALLGWAVASGFQQHIERFDHWIAFGLLSFLGVKMIRESFRKSDDPKTPCRDFDFKNTLLLGIATSIDALITGAAMALLTITILPDVSPLANMLTAAGIISAITFIACIAGIFLGRTAGDKLGKYAEIAGGIILICIGLKVLCGHLLG